ncbi:hypothetical protein E4634_10815 [Mangrovimicrobium sediminis]|uniref:Uncharacterized protein n=1 Tax=Mangrovimicrobium sediminis TaxID=2562682 RepID=A0A4Z0M1E4_9GAMM|nr:hypothetical protein [Haliea sp. SAOS-164]TGD73513.1 hypothetical protein E4634_10815 [Haliea sp. SAOS-164]
MFEHTQLDGEKHRVLATQSDYLQPEVLEIREPKNGQPVDKACRTQFGVVGEVLVERYLPSEATGEAWPHDSAGSPWWSVVGHPPHGGIVADFNKYIGGAYHRQLDPANNIVAYAEQGEAVVFDGSDYVVTRKSDEQELRGPQLIALRQQYYN